MRIPQATVGRAQPDTHSVEIWPIQHVNLWCVVGFFLERGGGAVVVHNRTEDDQTDGGSHFELQLNAVAAFLPVLQRTARDLFLEGGGGGNVGATWPLKLNLNEVK